MSNDALAAHSVVEAWMYVLATPCAVCRHGACEPSLATCGGARVRIAATCRNCGTTVTHLVDVPHTAGAVDPLSSAAPINDSDEPSQIIDAVQWVTLAQMMLDAAKATPDAQERRWRRVRAAQCLDEAVRFYDADNELPPANALFVEASRAAVRGHPQRYVHSRLVSMRAALPVDGADRRVDDAVAEAQARKPWWRFW